MNLEEKGIKGTCIHEASHLVFNRLMQKLNIDFPQPKYLLVSGAEKGEIDAGWVTHANDSIAREQHRDLNKRGRRAQIAQIMYQIAGYVSYQYLVDEKEDKCDLALISIRGGHPSDISKINIIAGKITGNTLVRHEEGDGGQYINDDNIELLKPIKESVKRLIETKGVKNAIEMVEEKLGKNLKKRIEGSDLQLLIQRVDKIIYKIDIQNEVDKLLTDL